MKKLIFCTQEVNKSNIRREDRYGVEHIIITSFTLPPDIVMNRVLYPKEVTRKNHKTFNRTPATIEHPQINGNFVLASDPESDLDFRIGAFNENAEIIGDGRLKLDKVVNVQKALKSDKGKRLLDRIEELETSSNARPIHTSIGALVQVDMLGGSLNEFNGVKTNAEYDSVVINMIGDHDAFLLDSAGAATPTQGTGIGINSEHFKVDDYFINDSIDFLDKKAAKSNAIDLRTNQELSFEQIGDGLYKALKDKLKGIDDIYPYIVEIYDDNFIYELENTFYRASYDVDEKGNVLIQDNKVEVVLKKEYITKATQTITTEDNDMISRSDLIAMLTSADIKVNADISDEDLKAEFDKAFKANASKEKTDIETNANKDLVSTVKDLTAEVETLKTELKTNSEKGVKDKIAVIKNCKKYSALPESALTLMANTDNAEFETMYNDSIPSHGIGSSYLSNDNQQVDDEMFAVNVGEE